MPDGQRWLLVGLVLAVFVHLPGLTAGPVADDPLRYAETFTELGQPMRLQVIIETNAGLEAAYEIAQASDRVDALLFGGVDLAADLRNGLMV